MLAAPGRLSITNVCPSVSPSLAPNARAMMSEPPPGAYGTTKRIGRDGYRSADWESVGRAAAASATIARMSVGFMFGDDGMDPLSVAMPLRGRTRQNVLRS